LLDKLDWVYKPTPLYSFSYIYLNDAEKSTSFGIGGSFGMTKFTPKEEKFYYQTDNSEIGYVTYSDYKMYQLLMKMELHFIDNEIFEPAIGLHGGFFYTGYDYYSKDETITDGTTFGTDLALCPNAGVNINITENFGVSLQAIYNVYVFLGDLDDNMFIYHPDGGSINYFTTINYGIHYRFN